MTAIKIEQGVPIPEARWHRGGRWSVFFQQMQPGDSFEFPEQDRQAVNVSASAYRRRVAPHTTWRVRKTGVATARVWRVK